MDDVLEDLERGHNKSGTLPRSFQGLISGQNSIRVGYDPEYCKIEQRPNKGDLHVLQRVGLGDDLGVTRMAGARIFGN